MALVVVDKQDTNQYHFLMKATSPLPHSNFRSAMLTIWEL